jgi:bacteriorhodopsin
MMWSYLVKADPSAVDIQFLGLLALGIFLLYTSLFSEERLMGIIGSVLGTIVWWALGGWWLVMMTEIPGLAWIFYAVGMACFLVLIYGVWGYYFDKKGILSGPVTE